MFKLFAVLAAALALAAPAAAAPSRIWVSGHGVDAAGCGAPTAPCRSLQFAHDAIAAGGEIDILDPAGYGALTVTKSISVVNDGVGTAGVQGSGRDAIDINAGAADVYLKGLNVDGVGRSGLDGIRLNAGANLTIVGCVVRHFNHDGINLTPASGLPRMIVGDSSASDNGGSGVEYNSGPGNAISQLVIERVLANNNGLDGALVASSPAGFVEASVNGSTMTNNSGFGVAAIGNVVVGVDLSVMEANTFSGAYIQDGATVHLSRSALIQNGQFGIMNFALGPGSVFTTGDNRLFANNSGATSGPAPVPEAPQ